MQFVYHKEASQEHVVLKDDTYKHLFKSRRQRANKTLYLRNLEDVYLYAYQVSEISKKEARLTLISKKEYRVENTKKLHFGWCMVDPKTIEKALPSLNELGVNHLSFIYADRSQKSYKLNMSRIEKILISSSEQCGRSTMMRIDTYNSLQSFITDYPTSIMLHFSANILEKKETHETYIIGPEGGFSEEEIRTCSPEQIRGLNTNTILKSETAILSIASQSIYKG